MKTAVGGVSDNPLRKYSECINSLPVGIGAPSWVWPGGYAKNVEKLKSVFKEVQILVLEPPDRSPIDKAEIEALRRFESENFSYSVHLPVPGKVAAKDDAGVRAIVEIIETFEPITVDNYVLHMERDGKEFDPELAVKRLGEIIERSGVEPERICVENLHEDFGKTWEAVKRAGVSICFDAGHILFAGGDPFSFIDKYREKIRMAHIHGVDGADHKPLTSLPGEFTIKFLERLQEIAMPGAVIIENYTIKEMRDSLQYLCGLYGCDTSPDALS
ncbi:MAG: hypothetical protein IEMM0002_1031 [bacterium]|nr:MAG: hypothetical protein IEMM0002_1031 [bacterium]